MRLFCWFCQKSVSTEVSGDTVFRAIAVCPECVEKKKVILRGNEEPEDACEHVWLPNKHVRICSLCLKIEEGSIK